MDAQVAGADASAGSPEPPRPTGATTGATTMDATPDEVAAYTACRAFLAGEWLGALLMVASFGQLYIAVGSNLVPASVSLVGGLVAMALGSFMFVRNRTYYERLGFPWRKRWHVAAFIVAGSGAIFWLLFVVLWLLTLAGIAIL